mgnify:CR=1 FL=1
MAEDISIKVNVGDRIYPLKINAREEEQVRKAAKQLNERIAFFNSHFSVKDKTDGIAMAALEYAVDTINKSITPQVIEKQIDFSEISNSLKDLENTLS